MRGQQSIAPQNPTTIPPMSIDLGVWDLKLSKFLSFTMADPFSITVGALTLLDTAGKIGKFLKKVVGLRNAPSILLALNNETEKLHLVVQRVSELLQRHSEALGQAPDDGLTQELEKVQWTLLEFEKLISYDLTVIQGDDSRLRLDKSAWLTAEADLQRLKDRIRADKSDLTLALNLFTR